MHIFLSGLLEHVAVQESIPITKNSSKMIVFWSQACTFSVVRIQNSLTDGKKALLRSMNIAIVTTLWAIKRYGMYSQVVNVFSSYTWCYDLLQISSMYQITTFLGSSKIAVLTNDSTVRESNLSNDGKFSFLC